MNSVPEIISLINTPQYKRIQALADTFKMVKSQFNIFDFFDDVLVENSWSRILAFFFDSEESHALGNEFFRKYLQKLYEQTSDVELRTVLNNIDTLLIDVKTRISCITEYCTHTGRRIDILARIMVEDSTVAVVGIENKIDSDEQYNQIKDYQHSLRQQFPSAKKLMIFLTPDLRESKTAQKLKTCPCMLSSYDTIAEICRRLNGHIESDHLKFLTAAIAGHIQSRRGEFMHQEEIRKAISELYSDEKHRHALKLIRDFSPNFADVQRSIITLLDNTMIIDNVKMTEAYCCGQKEIKIESVELNKLLAPKKLVPVFMLHCNDNPEIGSKFVFRVMLWERKLAKKSVSERAEIKKMLKKQFSIPDPKNDCIDWWEWVSLWVGKSYTLTDVGQKDVDGLANLMQSQIQFVYPQLKKRVITALGVE